MSDDIEKLLDESNARQGKAREESEKKRQENRKKEIIEKEARQECRENNLYKIHTAIESFRGHAFNQSKMMASKGYSVDWCPIKDAYNKKVQNRVAYYEYCIGISKSLEAVAPLMGQEPQAYHQMRICGNIETGELHLWYQNRRGDRKEFRRYESPERFNSDERTNVFSEFVKLVIGKEEERAGVSGSL